MSMSFTHREKIFLLATCGLAFGLRLFQLNAQSMWFDESISALIAVRPFWDGIVTMLEEGLHHTPLYYLLLRPFAAWGFNEFLLRFVSVLFGVLLVPLAAHLGPALGHKQAGLAAALLVAVNPFHTWYSQEARPYALLAFVSAGAMLFFVWFLNRPDRRRNLVGLTLFLAAGFNTHHFMFFVPLVQFVYLVLTLKRTYPLLRPWMLAQALAGLSLLPWAVTVISWGNFYMNSSAHAGVGLRELFNTFWNFSLGYTGSLTWLAAAALAACAGLALLALRYRTGRARPGLVLLWLLLPPLVSFVISLRLPMYLDRYLIVSFAPFVLWVALGLAHLPRRLGYPVLALLVAAATANLVQLYVDPAAPQQRADWRGAGHYLDEHHRPGDHMMILYHQDLAPLNFYYHGSVGVTPVSDAAQIDRPQQGQQLWLITAYPCENEQSLYPYLSSTGAETDPFKLALQQWQERQQPYLQNVIDFDCVRLYQY